MANGQDRLAGKGVILASASPRRRELLEQIGVRYEIAEHTVSEVALPGEPPTAFVSRLALEKAQSAHSLLPHHPWPVLGADTIVVCDHHILGKPVDKADALRMWTLLSGRDHFVYSAVALVDAVQSAVLMSTTRVGFRELTEQDCEAYWSSGEPEGKAGAYAIQGLGALFVSGIEGSYTGVVGLPLFETASLLQRFGVTTGLGQERDYRGLGPLPQGEEVR
ncbi:MAG: septum formation protein Maf [Gammaproteobacteria bacterium RIFCSPLOWO2_02_FULL_57_10]|nr:MAG: septum formation protein Maf [Gammaproteobacteria bacterium RIFCSPLOWO2_02_FULL_57_10]